MTKSSHFEYTHRYKTIYPKVPIPKGAIPMARLTRPLSATEVEKARPDVKTKFLFDGGGLYLGITPKGKKLWRFKYRVSG